MPISPLIFFAFLLTGLALSYFVSVRWTRAANLTAAVVMGFSLIFWFLLGQQLPFDASLSNSPLSPYLLSWQWQGDETIWRLSGVFLLFLFSLLLYRTGQANQPSSSSQLNWQLSPAGWQPVLLLALTPVGLSVIWSATLASFMISWTLFVALWSFYLLTTGQDPTAITRRMFWMLLPLLFTGFAAAIKPVGSELLNMSGWSQPAIIAVALTIMAQMGVMPFVGWRPRTDAWQPIDGPVIFLLPPLIGAGLLIRLVTTGYIEPVIILILTVFALISILSGTLRSWTDLHSTSRLPLDIALSLTGLTFLTAIWTGAQSALAGVHLLVFSGTILFFLGHARIIRQRWWRAIGPAVLLLALAAFPLTAGFAALNPLYTLWLTNGFWILVLVLLLLLLPLISAVLINVRNQVGSDTKRQLSPVTEIAQLLPASGLIMVSGFAFRDIHWATWLIFLVTAAGSLLLAHFVGEVQEAITTVDTALAPERLPLDRINAVVHKIFRQIIYALSEAAYILEGDRGLLWLSAFLAILLLAVSL